ncbi:hypothetical protein [Micromonospora sp. NPDC126480]|uniref:hypothetical protein n=1 Tax=Micromonospora sp. NPDC126480 TaxID=3155312 RepID=UPI003324AEAA
MSQPNDRTAPDEPTAYLGGDATAYLGGDATVHLSGDATAGMGGDATVHLAAGDGSTVRLSGAEPTARLAPGQPTAGEPTVRLGAAEPADERTVHLGAPAPTDGSPVTAGHSPTAGRRPPGTGEPTAAAPVQWTTAAGRASATGPAAAWSAPGRTPAPGPATIPGGWSAAAPGGARTGGAAAAGGEIRFGPGVPAAPPPAPSWPAAAPRRRSLWRRVASVLSTLLTLVLMAIAGLYLWQRLSPLEITDVTVAVPEPAGTRCDVTVDVVATVTTNGRAGEIRYQWLRSGSAPGTVLTERVGYGQRTARLTLRWSFSGVGSTAETATVNILEPAPAQARAAVAYDCGG